MKNKKNTHGFAMILEDTKNFDTETDSKPITSSDFKEWINGDVEEGKLTIDVAQNDTHIFVVSTMAGARPDKVEVMVHNDLLTIRGTRYSPLENEKILNITLKNVFGELFLVV